jgi:hypothetical protein
MMCEAVVFASNCLPPDASLVSCRVDRAKFDTVLASNVRLPVVKMSPAVPSAIHAAARAIPVQYQPCSC